MVDRREAAALGAMAIAAAALIALRRRRIRNRPVLLWLRHRLRVHDSSAFTDARALGSPTLCVVYTWQHGHGATPTAASAFEAAAISALDKQLQQHGNNLTVLCPPSSTLEVAAIASYAKLVDAAYVLVDCAADAADDAVTSLLEAALETCDIRVATARADDATLLSADDMHATLGRCRTGGGGKVLRWASFLATSMRATPPPPSPPPSAPLPPAPPHLAAAAGLTVPPTRVVSAEEVLEWACRRRWAQRMLGSWSDVSEAGAHRRAADAGEASRRAQQDASTDIGEATRSEVQAKEALAATAEDCAAPPMAANSADGAADGGGDGVVAGVVASEAGGAGVGGARPSRLSPFLRFGVISPRACAALGVRQRDLLWRDWSQLCWRSLGAMRRQQPIVPPLDTACLAIGDGGRCPPLFASADEAFDAWCVGRTGAPIVDAGMRQLWVEGWMPRRVRLLCACCLTEGLGVDWRRGRDWFAYTLIDHDPAINECMWQNAGLCGVDSFYRALPWERHVDSDDDDAEGEYVRAWLHELEAPPAVELRWPPRLLAAVARPRPPHADVMATASARRDLLRDAYWASGLVSRTGIKAAGGEAVGVGRLGFDELKQRVARRAQKRWSGSGSDRVDDLPELREPRKAKSGGMKRA